MKPANASRQPFKCNHFKGTKPLWWNNPPDPQQPHHLFHSFMFLFMSSWSRQYFFFLAASAATPLLVSYQDSLVSWAPCFAYCQRKGQPSLSQRRMCLLVPHPPQCVHKNLHNSSRKCQHTESMVIRRLWHYSCLPCCDLEELAENSLSANKRPKWWIILFSSWNDHSARTETGDGDTKGTCYFLWLLVCEGKSDKFWRIWARRSWPLLFLTGFW